MQELGWVIWWLGCLMLLNSLLNLKKKRGRILRAIFCAITATALALTYFTPLSKFHLLWILPLRLLFGLISFGLLASAGVAHHKITARKPEKTALPDGSYPPFGELKWSSYEWWEGKALLPAWAGFQARGGAYDSKDSDEPSDGTVQVQVEPGEKPAPLEPTPEQCRAMEFQIQHGDEIVESVLTALLPYYRELKKDWELNDKDMPPVSDATKFRNMIGLGQVHVLPHVENGMAYVGLEFGCDWDDEHGLGVVVHGKRVVAIGQADEAFSWQPEIKEEAEEKS